VDQAADLPALRRQASLYDALAAMLTAGTDRVIVTGEDGQPAGVLDRNTLATAGQTTQPAASS
jgi:osmoprotectant transport system ATP-binding protein